jgi:hypothetical protein
LVRRCSAPKLIRSCCWTRQLLNGRQQLLLDLEV